jgi:hypothetical protein
MNVVGLDQDSEQLTQENNTSRNDASNIIIHCLYGHYASTRKKVNDTCGKAVYMGTINRGFAVFTYCDKALNLLRPICHCICTFYSICLDLFVSKVIFNLFYLYL